MFDAYLVKAFAHDAAVVEGNILLPAHGDIEFTELLVVVVGACCQFLVVLLGTHRVLHAFGSIGPPTTAEDTYIAEQFGMVDGSVERIETAHRQSSHGTMVGIGQNAVVLFHHGNAFLKQFLLKVTAVGIRHDHDKLLSLALSYQILEDDIGTSLQGPSAFVLTAAVQDVEHRILAAALFLIGRGEIDEHPSPGLVCLAVIAAHGCLAVGHVGRLEPVVVVVRHFDARSHPAAAVERL